MSGPNFIEPPVDPLADTNPSMTIPPVRARREVAGWRRAMGIFSLLGALAFTAATVILLLLPGETGEPPPPTQPVTQQAIEQTPVPTALPTDPVPTSDAQTSDPVALLPTISVEGMQALLNAPLSSMGSAAGSVTLISAALNPFTLVPDRPRSEVIQYEAVQGDTIYTIAERFGLQPETIAWSNPRRIVQVLRPGDVLNIPPVDGVYPPGGVVGRTTVAQLAAQYGISDPYTIINSEFNNLFGFNPDDELPSGTKVLIPGGQAEEITWNPVVEREGGGGSGSSGDPAYITFAPGQPGSCGRVVNPGGGAYWANPLPNGTWVRGYTSWHTGVDVASPPGTAVMAANGGRVIFRGWNNWGYGNTVVLAHGPFTTLYGHLSGFNVGCGQDVTPGQVIAFVGSTGNSSGPHLHFEVRYNDIPADPLTIGVGW